MVNQFLPLVRAGGAAGLLLTLGSLVPATAAEPSPAPVETRTLSILEAQSSGAAALDLRGQGQDRVKVEIRNTTPDRLRIVLPPGLVAASSVGQGFQSMGLGAPSNRIGSFGRFQPANPDAGGFRSVAPDAPASDAVAVPPGKTVTLILPAVCLNFGKPTPTPRDHFRLMAVEDYTQDVRVRTALKALGRVGTSQGVAQAVMWHVCNGLSFEKMAQEARKVINPREIALAARFVEAIDAGDSKTAQAKVRIRLASTPATAKAIARLREGLDGMHVLGLPVEVVAHEGQVPTGSGLFLAVTLAPSRDTETQGRLTLGADLGDTDWTPVGAATFSVGSSLTVLEARELVAALDRALANEFVKVKTVRRVPGGTVVRIENHLPLTLSAASLRAGQSSGAPGLSLDAFGVGPGRSTTETVQAGGASIESVTLNGF